MCQTLKIQYDNCIFWKVLIRWELLQIHEGQDLCSAVQAIQLSQVTSYVFGLKNVPLPCVSCCQSCDILIMLHQGHVAQRTDSAGPHSQLLKVWYTWFV